jgi:Flp pilus assembly protein TadD
VIVLAIVAPVFIVHARGQSAQWARQLRRYAAAQNWPAAMKLVDQQLAIAPADMDLHAWRARLLTWSGHLCEAEQEYRHILQVTRTDPDIWLGLSAVYVREGKIQQAQQAIDTAESLDPCRADIHAARGRILLAAGERSNARLEFQTVLALDPSSEEARAGLLATRGEPKHDLRVGQDNDFLSYANSIHGEYAALTSRWTSRWTTTASGHFYQYYGVQADKFLASVTRRQPRFAAITLGAAISHDNAVIPRSEAFFAVDRGWKTSHSGFMRGVEFAYEQHWYWYESARILTLAGTTTFYLPQSWTFSLGANGARSTFSANDSEWKPSESSRLEFPFARWGEKQLFGNIAFSVGTENFAQVDQIGRFASQTYGSGLRFRMTPRQGVSEYVSYQKRTQNKSDIGFGLSYDLHF